MFKNISGLIPIRPLKIHLATPTLSTKTSYSKSRRGIQLEVGVESYGLQDLLSKHPKRVKRTQHLLSKINQLGLGVLQLASVGVSFGFLIGEIYFLLWEVQVIPSGLLQIKAHFSFGKSRFLRQKSSNLVVKSLTKLWK